MCGISAIISSTGHDVRRLLRMHAPIAHRGPDGEGFLAVTRDLQLLRAGSAGELEAIAGDREIVVSVAFRWLKIQDVSESARQPMSTADGAVWIAFNGEIYNFPALREELEGLGHRFRTHSDTEVALAAYVTWGIECFARFNGMWAMVIVDLPKRSVVVSRDRIGIKPLFESIENGLLLLSSEAKQIATTGENPPHADADSLARFVAGDRPSRGRTFFAGIRSFPAASTAVLEIGAEPLLEPRRYWNLALDSAEVTYARAVEEADELLHSAVDLELIADVGVGTLLSGGLDSSLVTMIARQSGMARPAYSFVLEAEADRHLDESRYIDEVARAAGVVTHKTTMDPAWVIANLRRVTWAQETPVTGLPVMAQFKTHELAASTGIKVVLDGQGADEVFGGYLRHQAIYLNDLLRAGQPIDFTRELLAFSRVDRSYPLRYLRNGILAPLRQLVDPTSHRQPSWFLGTVKGNDRDGVRRDRTGLAATLYRDVMEINLPTVLGITDRNSMSHSLEARVPLLDHRLVELGFRLPSSFKIGGGVRKRILRTVARRYIPANIVERRDSLGFGTPQLRWLRGELVPSIVEARNDEIFRRSTLFDSKLLAAERNESRQWMILALRAWFHAFDVRPE
jgi:asparagine synthase (glutamine-hydrolysing)